MYLYHCFLCPFRKQPMHYELLSKKLCRLKNDINPSSERLELFNQFVSVCSIHIRQVVESSHQIEFFQFLQNSY